MHLKMNQAKAIREKLLNDSTSTYEEMLEYFVNTVGISERMAKDYLASRNAYLNHPAFKAEKSKT